MTDQEKQERIDQIISLRKERNSYQSIGDVFGITRERVRQLLKRYAPDLARGGIIVPRGGHVYISQCKTCGKEVERVGYKVTFCSKICAAQERRKYPHNPYLKGTSEFRHFQYELRKKYNPGGFRRLKEAMKKRRKWRYAHDPRFIQLQREASNRYLARIRSNHERYALYLKSQRDAYRRHMARIRKDPAMYAKYLAEERRRHAAYYLRKKSKV